jgi:hypothetical protein
MQSGLQKMSIQTPLQILCFESKIAFASGLLVDKVAEFFDNKIKVVLSQTNIDPEAYN